MRNDFFDTGTLRLYPVVGTNAEEPLGGLPDNKEQLNVVAWESTMGT